ncbi:MAG: hypothetical protein GY697_07805, partial [Desulfobacterales bacterium]|nr:hypothetical protein [Desulfobacterales bacterium]
MKRHTAGHNKGTLFNLLWVGCFFLFCSQLSAAAPNQIHGQITVADQKLTLVAEKAPLESLLQQIAAKSDLAIVFHGSLAQTVTLSLHDLPLEQGLRRLLKNCSFSFQY